MPIRIHQPASTSKSSKLNQWLLRVVFPLPPPVPPTPRRLPRIYSCYINALPPYLFLISHSQGIIRHLYLNETLQQAMNAPRIHHQLTPMVLKYEEGLDANVVAALEGVGHVMSKMNPDGGFAAATAIARVGNKYSAVYDKRRLGSISIL